MLDVLTENKADKKYRAVFLENEYVQILILPEIGGRWHGGATRPTAIRGSTGSPRSNRGWSAWPGLGFPAGSNGTFPMGTAPPASRAWTTVSSGMKNGGATVWVGKPSWSTARWLVGMTLFPGRSYLRCDYICVNPTDQRYSFERWAVAATYANEWSQIELPADLVTYHGETQFWRWPVDKGVDLTWWKNSPNASSYFAYHNPSRLVRDVRPPRPRRDGARGGPQPDAGQEGLDLGVRSLGPYLARTFRVMARRKNFEPQAGLESDNQPGYRWIEPNEVSRTPMTSGIRFATAAASAMPTWTSRSTPTSPAARPLPQSAARPRSFQTAGWC